MFLNIKDIQLIKDNKDKTEYPEVLFQKKSSFFFFLKIRWDKIEKVVGLNLKVLVNEFTFQAKIKMFRLDEKDSSIHPFFFFNKNPLSL